MNIKYVVFLAFVLLQSCAPDLQSISQGIPGKMIKYAHDAEKKDNELKKFNNEFVSVVNDASNKYGVFPIYSGIRIVPLGKSLPRRKPLYKFGVYILASIEYPFYRIEPNDDPGLHPAYKHAFEPFVIEGKYIYIFLQG